MSDVSSNSAVVTDPSRKMKSSSESSNKRRIFPATLAKNGVTGLIAAGIYQGTRTETGKYGEETFVLIEGLDGSSYEIKNAGNLLARLTDIGTDKYVEVNYNGKKESTKGKYAGKALHNFFVNSEVE